MPRGYFFLFFFTRIESSLSRGIRRGSEDETVFLLFWYATAPLVKRMFLLSFFGSLETLLGSIIDDFGTGLFHFSPLVKRIILSGIISGDLIFNFSFPHHILVQDSDE